MIAGFCYIAVAGIVGSSDPEAILPTIIVKMVPIGLKGVLLAALLAAFMSGFSSVINAAASMIINDLVIPLRPSLSTRTLVRYSYVATVAVVVVGILVGFQAETIKGIWVWMLTGVIGATLFPNLLRWHWWRFNGWGYTLGITGGLLAAFAVGVGKALGWRWALDLLEYQYAPIIWAITLLGSIVGSLATKPTDVETLKNFYARVRPIGHWAPIKSMCAPATTVDITLGRVIVNLSLSIAGIVSIYLAIFYIIGHYNMECTLCCAVAAICASILYKTWYKKLPTT
jgi:Na+/proline symporter